MTHYIQPQELWHNYDNGRLQRNGQVQFMNMFIRTESRRKQGYRYKDYSGDPSYRVGKLRKASVLNDI